MLILTVDTTSEHYGLALSQDLDEPLARRSGQAGRALDIVLFQEIRDLLAGAGTTLAGIGRLVVCVGPGSFVGTRIGLAAVNTFAMVHAIPVVAVGALAALASLADTGEADTGEAGAKEVVAAVNCVRDEVFHQRFAAGQRFAVGQRFAAGPEPRSPLQPLGGVEVSRFGDFAAGLTGQPVVLRPSSLGHSLEAGRIAALPGVVMPDYDTLLSAIARLGAALPALPAGSLPFPLYVKPETIR
jgi:tRNA threonylcarbamoyl adenosine modification protein YeaZ